jgi:hypothetical protein
VLLIAGKLKEDLCRSDGWRRLWIDAAGVEHPAEEKSMEEERAWDRGVSSALEQRKCFVDVFERGVSLPS